MTNSPTGKYLVKMYCSMRMYSTMMYGRHRYGLITHTTPQGEDGERRAVHAFTITSKTRLGSRHSASRQA